MGETGYEAYRYSTAAVLVFGILGNILVIISILRQTNLLKNNYYYLVLHLAICDLGALIIYLLHHINGNFLKEPHFVNPNKFYCLFYFVSYTLAAAAACMMLVISVLRYRATVHSLKPAISRRKLKVVCGLVYVVGLIAGYGPAVPNCFMLGNAAYEKYHLVYFLSSVIVFPTIFTAIVYFKIGRTLIKQNQYMKSVCSDPLRRSAPSSSFNIMKHIRNRKTFFVCLNTVFCYAVGNIVMTVYQIWQITDEDSLMTTRYIWIFYLGNILRIVGSHSVNPLIYGILDKRLFQFWKLCRKKKKRRSQEN